LLQNTLKNNFFIREILKRKGAVLIAPFFISLIFVS